MTDDIDEALVAVLGETEAVWEPLRDLSRGAGQWQDQQLYRKAGVPWPGGGTTNERKIAHRLLSRAEREGLVTVGGRGAGKTVLVRLTNKGFERARKAAGVPSLAESRKFLALAEGLYARLRRKRFGADRDCVGGHLVTEAELVTGLGRDAARVEALALPSLERGWLTSGTAVNGAMSYFITEAGQAVVAAGGGKGKSAK